MMNKKRVLSMLGASCKRWRMCMGYSLKQMAEETGYSPGTISAFERGKNNNVFMFIWYLSHGFSLETDFTYIPPEFKPNGPCIIHYCSLQQCLNFIAEEG